MSDNIKFIEREKNEINNLLSGLNSRELDFLQNDITFINYLLSLLENPNLTPDKKKEIKKEITKDIDKLQDQTKQDQKENIGTYTFTSQIRPNTSEVDNATIDKAHMVKASSIVYDENGSFEKAQQYLDQNETGYNIDTELSNSDGLVLHNPQTDDVKVSYRGTKFSNANDLYTDGLILTGYESRDIIPDSIKNYIGEPKSQFDSALEQARAASTKYGSVPSEALGYSLGGAKAISVADRLGIPKSTTFNPFLGRNNVSDSPSSTEHTVWRTTQDIPSILVGFKNNHQNYTVKAINPHVDSLNPKRAHELSNFLTNTKKRAAGNLEDLSVDVARSSGRLGEAVKIANMKKYLRGEPDTIKDTDVLQLPDATSDIKNPVLGHLTRDPDIIYDSDPIDTNATRDFFRPVMPDTYLVPPPQIKSQAAKNISKRVFDRYLANGEIDNQEHKYLITSDVENNYNKAREIAGDNIHKYNNNRKIRGIKNTLKGIEKSFKLKRIDLDTYNKQKNYWDAELYNTELTGEGELRFKNELTSQKAVNDSRISRLLDRLPRPSKFDPTTHPLGKPTYPDLDLQFDILSDLDQRGLSSNIDLNLPDTDLSYTKWLHKFNSESGVDTRLNPDTNELELASNRFHAKSRHGKAWTELGKEFTDKEKEHFKNINENYDLDDDEWLLNQNERNKLYNASPEEETSIINDLSNSHLKSQFALEDHLSLPVETTDSVLGEAGTSRSMTNDLIRSAHPINLGIGLLAGSTVDAALNIYDPDNVKIDPLVRSGGSGAATGALAGTASLYLGGNPITAAALAPEIIGGAVGSLAATESYKKLKQSGMDENSATVSSGAIGGAATGAASSAVSALASGAGYGATLGVGESEFTFGTSIIAGAALGALIGEGSYLKHKYF